MFLSVCLNLSLKLLPETIARSLRSVGLRVMTPLSADGFRSQLKLASKHGASFAILLGEKELSEQKVVVKDLKKGQLEIVFISELVGFLKKLCT